LQLLQGRLERELQTLGVVALEVGLDFLATFAGWVAGREFGGEDDLIAVIPRRHPFTQPLL
jgi:hypothetical protein